MKYVYVAMGAMLGSLSRYYLSFALPVTLFPWHTISVNIIGSFLLGYVAFHPTLQQKWRFFLGVGALGSFTTFSTFALDIVRLLENNSMSFAALYIISSVTIGIFAAYLGMRFVKGRDRV